MTVAAIHMATLSDRLAVSVRGARLRIVETNLAAAQPDTVGLSPQDLTDLLRWLGRLGDPMWDKAMRDGRSP